LNHAAEMTATKLIGPEPRRMGIVRIAG
jgi:hypothetical protein